jgi:hypothetical protein
MYQLTIETYVGGEVRVVCVPARSPSRTPPPVNLLPDPDLLISDQKSNPPPLVNRLDSENPRPAGVSGFGLLPTPTAFGLPARRAIMRLSKVLDSQAQHPQDVVFFTGTLPGSTPSALLALSQWSGYMIHRLKAWANHCGPGLMMVYCWEWQRRGALHLHLAAWYPSVAARKSMFDGLRQEWIRLLFAIGDKSGVDLFARSGGRGSWANCLEKVRARAEWVRKSVASYLGKYLGKSAAPGTEKRRFFYPSRWWGSTMNLKTIERRSRWRDEYYYSSQGRAMSAMESMAAVIESAADWSATYQTKVVRGAVFVALGVRDGFAKLISRNVNAMEKKSKVRTLEELVDEFHLALSYIRNLKPKWFRGFVNSYSNMDRVIKLLDSPGCEEITQDTREAMLFAAARALEQSAAFNECWGGQWLGPRLVTASLTASRQLQAAYMEMWQARYPVLVDDECIRRITSALP